MKQRTSRLLSTLLVLCMVLALAPSAAMASAPKVSISEQYLYKGASGEWYTEESYRAAPVVTDLDGDGKLEVLKAAYSLSVMDAATGAEKWSVKAGRDRSSSEGNVGSGQVFCDFKVLDIDADGKKEIVIAYGNGSVSVLNSDGYFKSGWPKTPAGGSIRSLAVDDLDGDGKKEIVVGAGVADAKSVWVYRCDGTLAPGWPQLDDSQNGSKQPNTPEKRPVTAYSYGVFGNGISTGDLDGDGLPEIIVPTDTAFIDAYNYDGSLVKASDIFADKDGGRMWGKIALWEDYSEEIAHKNEGWGGYELNTRAQTYKAELGNARTVYTDVDGDGISEIVLTAMIVDRTTYETKGNNYQTIDDTRYMTVFILNQDRSRYVNERLGFDWTSAPNDLTSSIRGPLKSYEAGLASMSGNVFPEPTCADLNGDGYKEILFNSYDGMVHCFSLDKKEWSFKLPKTTSTVFEYASPIVCKDLDGDGTQEVIFASWTDCQAANKTTGTYAGTGVNGALYVLSSEGELLARQDLHNGYTTYEDRLNPNAGFTNGVMSAPAVEDIDGDGKFEVLLNTTAYALCAYKLTVESTTPAPTPPPSTPEPDTGIFADVPGSAWYYDYVNNAAGKGLIQGTGKGFEPDTKLNRASFVTLIVRLVNGGEPADVSGEWYAKYYAYANEHDLLDGLDADADVNAEIPRYEMAQMLYNAAKAKGLDVSASKEFTDDDRSYGTAYDTAIGYAYATGLLTGKDGGNFAGVDTLSRAEAAAVVWRFYELANAA